MEPEAGAQARQAAPTIPDPLAAIEDGELKFRLDGEKLRAGSRSSERRRPPRRRRAGEATSGSSSTRATTTRRPAGTPRTTRSASRPAGPTTTSRPTATRCGSRRRRPPSPRSTSPRPRGATARPSSRRCSRRSRTDPFDYARLALRDQVGRLPDRGDRQRRHGPTLDPQRQGRRDVLPGPPLPADLDRGGEAVVDGEVVALDPDGRRTSAAPGAHQRRAPRRAPRRRSSTRAFDLLYLDGRSLLKRPARGPQAAAPERAARARPGALREPRRAARARRSSTAAEARDLEGIIAKHAEPLRAGRRRATGSRSRSGPSRSSSSAATCRARGPTRSSARARRRLRGRAGCAMPVAWAAASTRRRGAKLLRPPRRARP